MPDCTCPTCDHSRKYTSVTDSFLNFRKGIIARLAKRLLTNAYNDRIVFETIRAGQVDEASRLAQLYNEVKAASWRKSSAQRFAEDMSNSPFLLSRQEVLIARDASGKLLGSMLYRTSSIPGDYYYVNLLGTTGEKFGTGTELLYEVTDRALKVGQALELSPVPSAETFYLANGMEPVLGSNHFRYSLDTIKALHEMSVEEAKYNVITYTLDHSPEISRASVEWAAEFEGYLNDMGIKENVGGQVIAYDNAGYPIDWTLIQKDALEWGVKYKELLVKEGATIINGQKVEWSIKTLAEDTRKDVADIILQGIKEGKPFGVKENSRGNYPKGSVASDLEDYFTSVKSHASMVARTEGKRAQNQGRSLAFREMGIRSVIGRSFDCCDLCAEEIDGQEYNFGEQPDLPLHPNCKCYWEPVIESAFDEDGNPIDESMFEENALRLHTPLPKESLASIKKAIRFLKNALRNLYRREEKNYGTSESGNHGHESVEGHRGGSAAGTSDIKTQLKETMRKTKVVTVTKERVRDAKDGSYKKGDKYEAQQTVQADGSPLPPHIKSIPPGWRNATFSEDPDADVLVKGFDDKGRPVQVRNPVAKAESDAVKFDRVDDLIRQYDEIHGENIENIKNPALKEEAECLQLIMENGVRPGSTKDTQAKVQAYGATTLKGEHVVIEGDSVHLKFTGKKGVAIDLEVPDPSVAKMLLTRKEASGDKGSLFKTTASKLSAYTHSLGSKAAFKTKDFRTHLATSTAKLMVKSMPKPKTKTAYKAARSVIGKAVSKKLGNKPAEALKSYIDPRVFSEWEKGL